MEKVIKAVQMAELFFRPIKRKYTGEPYLVHLLEVGGLVAGAGFDEDVVAAAILHDAIEDVGIDEAFIAGRFGERVARLVVEVTDADELDLSLKKFNRAERKRITAERLAKASPEAKAIKLADIISNTSTIVEHDVKFARLYLSEVRALYDLIAPGSNKMLVTRAGAVLSGAEAKLRYKLTKHRKVI